MCGKLFSEICRKVLAVYSKLMPTRRIAVSYRLDGKISDFSAHNMNMDFHVSCHYYDARR